MYECCKEVTTLCCCPVVYVQILHYSSFERTNWHNLFANIWTWKKKWLKSEMPGEVTDWSSPLFVHPRWGEAAFELSSYRSTTEKPWVGAPIIIRATPQHCCSRWKCLTYRIIILISVLLSRDSEISDLGRNIFLLFSGWRWCFSNFGVNLLWYLYITLEDRSQFTISVHLKVCFLQLQIEACFVV